MDAEDLGVAGKGGANPAQDLVGAPAIVAHKSDVPGRHYDEPRYDLQQYGPQGPHIPMRCLRW